MKRILAIIAIFAFLFLGCKESKPKTVNMKAFSSNITVIRSSYSGNYTIDFKSIGNCEIKGDNGLVFSWIDNTCTLSCFGIISEDQEAITNSIADKIKTVLDSNFSKDFARNSLKEYKRSDSCIYGDYEIELDARGLPKKITLKNENIQMNFEGAVVKYES